MTANRQRKAPPGRFRVIGHDLFEHADYLVGDYATLAQAEQEARARAAKPNAIPTSGSDLFFVYDDAGDCRYRINHDALTNGDELPPT